MPKIVLDAIPQTNATGYPPPFDDAVAERWYRRLAPVAGLTEFGASHVTLKPGAWSSQRHWHDGEDEFVVILAGAAMLVEDDGPTMLRAGDCAAWAKGKADGHHLRNEGDVDCVFVAISGGRRSADGGRLFGHRHDVHRRRPLHHERRPRLRAGPALAARRQSCENATRRWTPGRRLRLGSLPGDLVLTPPQGDNEPSSNSCCCSSSCCS